MNFRWIAPLYGFSAEIAHIAVPANAESTLLRMAEELVHTDDLIAIYIPKGTDAVYQPGNKSGRVIGAVRLLPMPDDKEITDYFYRDVDRTLRWPVGWPCEAVYAPPVEQCPVLKSEVEFVFNESMFRPYVARFQNGPFKLERKMADHLNKRFAGLA